MKSRGVHLQYSFQPEAQHGEGLHNTLFELLAAIHEHGSIQRAANALQASYRHVWGSLKQWDAALGQPLVSWVQGHPAHLTPFAERLLWAERRARARLAPQIEALRAELEGALAEALDGSLQPLTLFASHDPALAALVSSARVTQRLHIELHGATSLGALHALAEGHCEVAAFHAPAFSAAAADGSGTFATPLKALLEPGRHTLIGCTRRMQGLMVAPGNPLALAGLADVVGTRARFATRQPGSSTRLLTDTLLTQAALPAAQLVVACVEDTPGAVAVAVASGAADAGIGTETAARGCGLDFVPLLQEDGYLACADEALQRPAVLALRLALQGSQWQQAVAALPGHAPARPGELLALADALPWCGFDKSGRGH